MKGTGGFGILIVSCYIHLVSVFCSRSLFLIGCFYTHACRWVAVPDDEWPEDGAQRGVVMQVRGGVGGDAGERRDRG